MIKNIIFDFDGVIADSEILVAKAFSKYLESQNIDFSENRRPEKTLEQTRVDSKHSAIKSSRQVGMI